MRSAPLMRVRRWLVRVLAAIAAIAIGLVAFVYARSEWLLRKRYETTQAALVLSRPPDLQRGEHLVLTLGCAGCHGAELQGGRQLPGGEIFGTKIPANLTLLAQTWTDQDFVRVIRRGVLPDGTSVIVMPAMAFRFLTDDDVAAVIAHVRSRPAGGEAQPPPRDSFAKRAMLALGMFSFGAQQVIDEADTEPIRLGAETERGRYLAVTACGMCHGRDLKGQPAPPLFPQFAPPDLATAAGYSREAFESLLRTGRNAAGAELGTMSSVAGDRLRYLDTKEVDDLYAYLVARAAAIKRL